MVLARLLSPAQFGVVGMAALFTGLVTMLGEVGLGAAIIHRQDISHTELNTVFWSGLAVAGLSAVASARANRRMVLPGTSRRDGHPRLRRAVFVIDALGAVHRVLLTKEMRFDRLARIEVGAAVA